MIAGDAVVECRELAASSIRTNIGARSGLKSLTKNNRTTTFGCGRYRHGRNGRGDSDCSKFLRDCLAGRRVPECNPTVHRLWPRRLGGRAEENRALPGAPAVPINLRRAEVWLGRELPEPIEKCRP